MQEAKSSEIKWAGIVLIVLTDLIHLLERLEYIEESGLLIDGSFSLNAAVAEARY